MYHSDLELGNELVIDEKIEKKKSKKNVAYEEKMKKRNQFLNQLTSDPQYKKRALKKMNEVKKHKYSKIVQKILDGKSLNSDDSEQHKT